jgi:hypothetical protein
MDVCGLAVVWTTDKHVSIAAVRYLYDGIHHWSMAGLVLIGWARAVGSGPGGKYSHGARLS